MHGAGLPGGVNIHFISSCIRECLGLEKSFLFLSSVLGCKQGGEHDLYQNEFYLMKSRLPKESQPPEVCLLQTAFPCTDGEVQELDVLLLQAGDSIK